MIIEPLADPPRYSWHSGVVLVSGSLEQYAQEWQDHMLHWGTAAQLSKVLLLWPHPEMEPRKVTIDISHERTDEDDFMHYKFSVPGDVVWAVVDKRTWYRRNKGGGTRER